MLLTRVVLLTCVEVVESGVVGDVDVVDVVVTICVLLNIRVVSRTFGI